METKETTKETKKASSKRVIVLLILLLLCVITALVVLLLRKPKEVLVEAPQTGQRIGYDEGTVQLDPEGLQNAIDEMYEKTKEGRIALEYKNDAISSDGKTFACYINNSARNTSDMYIGIYADAKYEDQLFLSGLIKPGTGFDTVTLDRELEPGKHRVFVVYTKVKENEDGEQVMSGQTAVTMDFTVREH